MASCITGLWRAPEGTILELFGAVKSWRRLHSSTYPRLPKAPVRKRWQENPLLPSLAPLHLMLVSPRRSLTVRRRSNLVGYLQWDARSDRFRQTIIRNSFQVAIRVANYADKWASGSKSRQ